jgi:hypothetical protein
MSPKCIENKCDVVPNYNFKGQTTGLYCNGHKKSGMVDVKNKKCNEYGCDT